MARNQENRQGRRKREIELAKMGKNVGRGSRKEKEPLDEEATERVMGLCEKLLEEWQ